MAAPFQPNRDRVCVTLRLADYRQSLLLSAKLLDPWPVFCSGYSPYVTSSLTGLVYRLQLLAFASAAILRSEPRGTHERILLSQILDSNNVEGQVSRIYIRQEPGGPVIPPYRHLL
jgi:hypothetical protein